MSAGRLTVSAEVAAVVGREDLEALANRVAAEGYDCAVCGEHSPDSVPAAVAVWDMGPGARWARVAHERCSPSAVIGPADLPGETPARAVAGLAPHASAGVRALVLVEMLYSAAVREGGERVDVAATGLLGEGLHLITSAGRLATPAGPGWSVVIPAPGVAVISGPGTAGTVYEGELWTPPGWLGVARRRGGAELLIGVTGIAEIGPDTNPLFLVTAAARAGRLVGGLVPVVTGDMRQAPAGHFLPALRRTPRQGGQTCNRSAAGVPSGNRRRRLVAVVGQPVLIREASV